MTGYPFKKFRPRPRIYKYREMEKLGKLFLIRFASLFPLSVRGETHAPPPDTSASRPLIIIIRPEQGGRQILLFD